MIQIALDALVLMVLLKALCGEEVDFWPAVGVALGAAIGASLIAFGLALALGSAMGMAGVLVGIVLGAMISAALLGAAVSLLYGAEINRAMLIGGAFVVVHTAIGIGLQLVFQRG